MRAPYNISSLLLTVLAVYCPNTSFAGQANFIAEVSQKCLAVNIDRPIDEESPVNDVILGATVTGRARLRGTLETRLVPCADHAIVELVGRGMIDSTTVSRKGRVAVSGISKTSVGVIKRVEIWNLDKVRIAPARVRCNTKSAIHDLSTGFRSQALRERARETVYEDRQLAEAEASRHAERKVAAQIDRLFGTGQSLLRERLLISAPLERLPQAEVLVRTMHDRLQYVEHRVGKDEKPRAAPPRDALGRFDVLVMGHESWFGALGDGLLAGEWISDEQVADGLKNLFGNVPPEYRLGTHMPRWSVQLDSQAPLSLSFEGSKISLSLRLSQTRIGDTVVGIPYEVQVHYHLACSEFGPELKREGGVVIRSVNSVATVEGDAEHRRFLERKLTAAFGELLYFDGLALPGGGQLATLKKLRPAIATAQGGWLILGWNLAVDTTKAARAELVQSPQLAPPSSNRVAR